MVRDVRSGLLGEIGEIVVRASSRSQFVWAVLLFLLAMFYGFGPGGDVFAVVLLAVAGLTLIWVGIALVPLRQPESQVARPEVSERSVWPILGAVAGMFAVLAFSTDGRYMLLAGAFALWALGGAIGQAWREDAGWNPHFSDRLGERIVRPIGLPLVAILIVFVLAVSVSRMLLANSEEVAVAIAFALAAALLVIFSVLAAKRNLSPTLLVGLSVVGVVATVTIGAAAAHKGAVEEEHQGTPAPQIFAVYAQNTTFVSTPDKTPPNKLEELDGVPADKQVEFTLDNLDDSITFHNLALYSGKGGTVPVWAGTPVAGGKTAKNTFTAPTAGTYTLRCDFHPSMLAKVVVTEKAEASHEE